MTQFKLPKYTPHNALIVLFSFVFLTMLVQIWMAVLDTKARNKLLKRLHIESVLTEKYAKVDDVITELHYDILHVNDYENRKDLFVQVAKAKTYYQDLKNAAIIEEHTHAKSTQMKVRQISEMQNSLKDIIFRNNDMKFDFQFSRAVTQLKRQTSWLQVFRDSERNILTKDIDKYAELMSANTKLNLYISGAILVIAFLTLVYLFRKQKEFDSNIEDDKIGQIKSQAENELRALGHKLQVANKMTQQREAELIHTKQQLIQSQKYESIGKLTSGLVREFTKVLNSIIGTAHILKNKLKDDDYLSVKVDTVIKQSIKGLDFSKQISRFTEENIDSKESKNINEIIGELRSVVETSTDNNIKFYLEISKEPLYAEINVSKLLQAIMNLVINAKEAMPHGGNLHVATEYVLDKEHKEWAKISVVDSGKGIPQEELNLIFDPKYTTKHHETSSGLGLSVVANIIREHRGRIEIYSTVGKGARFDIFIPCAKDKMVSEKEYIKRMMDNSTLLVDRSFLVVDNHINEAKLIENILVEYNGRVVCCDSSAEAIQHIQSDEPFDLVIIEIELDEMDGIDLYQELDGINSDLHVIFVSNVEEKKVAESIIHNDLTTFIAKPVIAEELLKQIVMLLEIKV